MTVGEAEALVKAAERLRDAVQSTIATDIAAARAEIEAAHRDALADAWRAVSDAKTALRDIQDQTPDHPWTGKRVFKMVHRGRSWERLPPERVEGIVETARSTTVLPENTASYARPRIGEPIVRLMLKTGAVGRRFEAMRGDHHGWKLVEGSE